MRDHSQDKVFYRTLWTFEAIHPSLRHKLSALPKNSPEMPAIKNKSTAQVPPPAYHALLGSTVSVLYLALITYISTL